MTYVEALKLTREERRKSANFRDERRLVTCNMSVAQREELGALFHEHTSALGEPSHCSYLTATVYKIATKAGKLELHYAAGWGAIFGRFEHAEVAAAILGTPEVNRYSGKWNTHTSKGDDPKFIFQAWKRQLERVLP